MGTVCLSPTPNLRCVGLSFVQEVIALVPAVLEVVFSVGLVFGGHDAGRIRYILAAEGPVYLLLIFLTLLGRIIPVFQDSLNDYKSLDILIGATSFIPILLYTSYLYLFKREEFFPHLPKRFTVVAKSFDLVIIPVIIVTNEIGSFVGVEYRQVPHPENYIVGNEAAVGSYLSSFQFGGEFLRSTSLAILSIYQAVTFLVFFMRLLSCIAAQRDIEDSAAAEREGVLFRGLGWLAIGMKISAIETAVGFATPSFGLILTRRVLRMLGRACIIIGVIKGPDLREEFLILDSDKGNGFLSGTRKLRMSGRFVSLSSPRNEKTKSTTLQRFSRMTYLRRSLTTFASPPPSISEFERTPLTSPLSNSIPTRTSVAAVEKFRPPPLTLEPLERPSIESRVSVVHGHDRAPTLVLHLSPVDLPNGGMLASIENEINTSRIDYVAVGATPLSVPGGRSAPLPWVTGEPPKIPFGSSSSKEVPRPSRSRQRSHTESSRTKSMPSAAVPLIPIDVPRTAASASATPDSHIWPSMEPPGSYGGTSVPAQRNIEGFRFPARSHRKGSGSTAGGISIDWIAPEGQNKLMRIKSLGTAPLRMTPNPTPSSSATLRGSVMLERHESLFDTRTQMYARSEAPRKDSGVLGLDDLAHVRRGSQNNVR